MLQKFLIISVLLMLGCTISPNQKVITEGKRLKMNIGIVASGGWNAGGSWVTPEWASKNLFFSKVEVDGPQTLNVDLPFTEFPEACPMKDQQTPVFHKEVSVLAFPSKDEKTRIKRIKIGLILNGLCLKS
jgi:hypothetical protein